MNANGEFLGYVLTALSSVSITAVINSYLNRRKVKAETDNIITGMYDRLLEEMRSELTRVQTELRELRNREISLMQEIQTLTKSNGDLGSRLISLEKDNQKLMNQVQNK